MEPNDAPYLRKGRPTPKLTGVGLFDHNEARRNGVGLPKEQALEIFRCIDTGHICVFRFPLKSGKLSEEHGTLVNQLEHFVSFHSTLNLTLRFSPDGDTLHLRIDSSEQPIPTKKDVKKEL